MKDFKEQMKDIIGDARIINGKVVYLIDDKEVTSNELIKTIELVFDNSIKRDSVNSNPKESELLSLLDIKKMTKILMGSEEENELLNEKTLKDTIIATVKFEDKELSDYFLTQINSFEKLEEEDIKIVLITNFIRSVCEIFFLKSLTISDTQLVLLKKDNKSIYFEIYDMSLGYFLNNYNVVDIKWNI